MQDTLREKWRSKPYAKRESLGKNTNFYRMWGKGERDVSYPSTKAITHRNALGDLKKKNNSFHTGYRKGLKKGRQNLE